VKIRNDEELLDFLAKKKQQRKRELISLKHDLTPRKGEISPRSIRAAIVLSYAHWEGFVKESALAYVHLVSHKSRALDSLTLNFQALVCRQEFKVAQAATKRIGPHIALVDRLTNRNGVSAVIDVSSAIDTESNLKCDVFQNICLSVGVDYQKKWAVEGPFIDDLFANRCMIAHGELVTPDSKYAVEVVDTVVRWIESFSSDIEEAALRKAYLRVS
jgi:hypothetical protein